MFEPGPGPTNMATTGVNSNHNHVPEEDQAIYRHDGSYREYRHDGSDREYRLAYTTVAYTRQCRLAWTNNRFLQ